MVIQVTVRKTDKLKGLFVNDIRDWDADSEGGSVIYFRDNREQIAVTDTNDSIKTKIDAALARPAASLAGAIYTPTNVSVDRSFDADATSTAELADVLGTLIDDLQSIGLIQ